MLGSYDYRLVMLSLLVAFVSCLVTFSLTTKAYRSALKVARLWRLGSAVVIGTGIWSMHFIGMLAFSLPVPVGYALDITVVSWLIAIAVSWVAFQITNRRELTTPLLFLGGVLMGMGISGMHYMGMYSMGMSPAITYDTSLVVLTLLTATAASMAALYILFWLRIERFESTRLTKSLMQ